MDSDEIANRLEEIKLLSSKHASPKLTIDSDLMEKGIERLALCLIAKVFSSRLVNRATFAQHMPKIIQPTKLIQIQTLGQNLFLCRFTSTTDRTRALDDGSWHLFNNLLSFKEVRGTQNPGDVDFGSLAFWIQCHNMPLAFMMTEIVEKIGHRLGRVIEVDKGEGDTILGRFARVRVEMDITNPLPSFLQVGSHLDQGNDPFTVLLTYERLPEFCYACGRVGHSHGECEDVVADKKKLKYGAWLKAAYHFGNRKQKPTAVPNSIDPSEEARNDPPEGNKDDFEGSPVISPVVGEEW
ncbi:uncharacterized protein [Henckelia pumila]|uniref:uncharacterized protein n=1 Tax=Henckelia pumila TaxID=405737 RepID=UPI003C6DDFB1